MVVLGVGSPLLPGRASAPVKSSLSHQRVCYLHSVLAPAAPPPRRASFSQVTLGGHSCREIVKRTCHHLGTRDEGGPVLTVLLKWVPGCSELALGITAMAPHSVHSLLSTCCVLGTVPGCGGPECAAQTRALSPGAHRARAGMRGGDGELENCLGC